MKKISLLLIAFAFIFSAKSQQVIITEGEEVADTSAILQLQSDKYGFILPRQTKKQTLSIYKAAHGLTVYSLFTKSIIVFDSLQQKWFTTKGDEAFPTSSLTGSNGGYVYKYLSTDSLHGYVVDKTDLFGGTTYDLTTNLSNVCDTVVRIMNGKFYRDWYLPTDAELTTLISINPTAAALTAQSTYWTKEQLKTVTMTIGTATIDAGDKMAAYIANKKKLRCIRRF